MSKNMLPKRTWKGLIVWITLATIMGCCKKLTKPNDPQIMYMRGEISGVVNGKGINFGLEIKLDMESGEETAAVTHMDPEMGAVMRQVTAMVTIGGQTGGATPRGGKNLFQLTGGNFVNSATMYWPGTGDSLELIHRVSYTSGDTMKVAATISGTVPNISAEDEVKFSDFTETLYWEKQETPGVSSQVVITGVGFQGNFQATTGFRQYIVGDTLFPGGVGKGSSTNYEGPSPPTSVERSARNISSTYNKETRTMHVRLINILTPVP